MTDTDKNTDAKNQHDISASELSGLVMRDEAPDSNLPTWAECRLRMENEKYLADNGLEDGGDTLLPDEIHRFIYEYDCSDEYKSKWWRYRLERLIESISVGG